MAVHRHFVFHTETVHPHKPNFYRIYLFLMNMTLPSVRTGSLTLRQQQTSPAQAEQGLPRQKHGV